MTGPGEPKEVVAQLTTEVERLRKLVDPDAEHARLVLLKDAMDAAIAKCGPEYDAHYGETIQNLAREIDGLRIELEAFRALHSSVNEAIGRAGIHCAVTFAEAIDQIAAERDRFRMEAQLAVAEATARRTRGG